MNSATNPTMTAAAIELPAAREVWYDLLRVVAEDQADDIDLYAHWDILRQATAMSADGTLAMTPSGAYWLDDVRPYEVDETVPA